MSDDSFHVEHRIRCWCWANMPAYHLINVWIWIEKPNLYENLVKMKVCRTNVHSKSQFGLNKWGDDDDSFSIPIRRKKKIESFSLEISIETRRSVCWSGHTFTTIAFYGETTSVVDYLSFGEWNTTLYFRTNYNIDLLICLDDSVWSPLNPFQGRS